MGEPPRSPSLCKGPSITYYCQSRAAIAAVRAEQ